MGALVAKKYPTELFLKLADHTYVECGSGAVGWSCWGGKSNGDAFNSGNGSTIRANAIAEPDERAGITCYLVNGVCHQAANRILYPAKKLVTGARGYGVSEALFGPYGKARGFLGFCKAPFHKHDHLDGNLEECPDDMTFSDEQLGVGQPDESEYIDHVMSLYMRGDSVMNLSMEDLGTKAVQEELSAFQLQLFDSMMRHRIGSDFGESDSAQKMLSTRGNTEGRLFNYERSFSEGEMDVEAFVEEVNVATIAFQTESANVLSEKEYKKLFGLSRDEQVFLGDIEIAREAYAGLNK